MYSAAPRPSSTRAAPAKKRIWSIIGGISSAIVTEMILPVFSASMATSSSAWASRTSAMRWSMRLRSDGVVRRHVVNAPAAAAHAASTSLASDTGISANGSPVTGLSSSTYWPLLGATASPPMKLVKRRMAPPARPGRADPRHSARRPEPVQLPGSGIRTQKAISRRIPSSHAATLSLSAAEGALRHWPGATNASSEAESNRTKRRAREP